MKKIITFLSFLYLASITFALPSAREIPANTVFLSVAEYTQAPSVKRPIPNLGEPVFIRKLLPEITSLTLAVTSDETSLPNGFVALIEGNFDAVSVMKWMVAAPRVQELLEAGEVTMLKAGLGDALQWEVTGFSKGNVLAEALSPNTIRIASAGCRRSVLAGNTLPGNSPFTELFVPGGDMKRSLFIRTNQVLNSMLKQMGPSVELLMLQPWLEVTEIKARCMALADGGVRHELTLLATSETAAQQLYEALNGYKMLLRSQLNQSSTDRASPKDVAASFLLGGLLDSLTFTQQNSRVLVEISATPSQIAGIRTLFEAEQGASGGTKAIGLIGLGIFLITGW